MRTQRATGTGELNSPIFFRVLTDPRTIHGMVYNAMKLFMEINPQLFDDCSHDYTEHQNNAEAREQARAAKWKALEDQAKRAKTNGAVRPPGPASRKKIDELDPITEDNQKRLDSLKLQDGDRRERRPAHDRQNSVGSSRSQR
jgi:serine/threonine-protein phosphatase 2A regulatory subunit B'